MDQMDKKPAPMPDLDQLKGCAFAIIAGTTVFVLGVTIWTLPWIVPIFADAAGW